MTAINRNFPQIRNIVNNLTQPFIPNWLEILKKHRKGVRDMYNIFISNLKENKKYITKWKSELQVEENELSNNFLNSHLIQYDIDKKLHCGKILMVKV